MQKAYQLAKNLSLIISSPTQGTVSTQPVKQDTRATNHRFWIDCSGSMYSVLRKLREHLKNRLATLVKSGDTVSIGWFSGRGQYGWVVKNFQISDNAMVLKQLHEAIDRYLVDVGLTGFIGPIEETIAAIDGVNKENWFFMSDGYDNQSGGDAKILAAASQLASKINAATVVEYGWSCNHEFMVKLAEAVGGTLISSEDFESYIPAFEAAVQQKVSSSKTQFNVSKKPIGNSVFTLGESGVNSVKVESGTAMVDADAEFVGYFVDTAQGDVIHAKPINQLAGALFAGAAFLAQRMDTNNLYSVLKALGDVRLITMFNSAFGKQNTVRLQEEIRAAAIDKNQRYLDGFDPNFAPDDNAYTVIDLLADLAAKGAKFNYKHSSFSYNAISARRVDKTTLTKDEMDGLVGGLVKATSSADSFTKALEAALTTAKSKRDKFIPASVSNKDLPGFDDLTYNSSRANVSLRFQVPGVLNLTIDDQVNAGLSTLHTYKWKQYALVADGIVNVTNLPVVFPTKASAKAVLKKIKGMYTEDGDTVVINLKKLPTINRNMVDGVRGYDYVKLVYNLRRLEAAQKVVKQLLKDQDFKKVSNSFAGLSQQQRDFIEQQLFVRLSDGSYSPPKETAEIGDELQAYELEVALEKLSTLPTIAKVQEKLKANKALTLSESLIAIELKEYEGKTTQELESALSSIKSLMNEYRVAMSKIVFSVVVGRAWFPEFAGVDPSAECEMALPGAGPNQEDIIGKIRMKDTLVKI